MKKNPEIVAELTINHLGMRKIAITMLQACKEIGVNYAKFKLKNVRNYYAKDGKKFNGYDFLDYRNSLELSQEDFEAIDKWCRANDMKWFATAHDRESLEVLARFDPPYFKIASMDAQNGRLLEETLELNSKKKPMIVSVGGLSMEAIREIVNKVAQAGIDLTLLHAVSIYPTPPEKCNVSQIAVLRREFSGKNVRIGYSGHEEGFVPTLMAVQYGATMIERHLTLTRNLQVHHIRAALCVGEFRAMVEDIAKVIKMMNIGDVAYFEEELEFLRDRKYT